MENFAKMGSSAYHCELPKTPRSGLNAVRPKKRKPCAEAGIFPIRPAKFQVKNVSNAYNSQPAKNKGMGISQQHGGGHNIGAVRPHTPINKHLTKCSVASNRRRSYSAGSHRAASKAAFKSRIPVLVKPKKTIRVEDRETLLFTWNELEMQQRELKKEKEELLVKTIENRKALAKVEEKMALMQSRYDIQRLSKHQVRPTKLPQRIARQAATAAEETAKEEVGCSPVNYFLSRSRSFRRRSRSLNQSPSAQSRIYLISPCGSVSSVSDPLEPHLQTISSRLEFGSSNHASVVYERMRKDCALLRTPETALAIKKPKCLLELAALNNASVSKRVQNQLLLLYSEEE